MIIKDSMSTQIDIGDLEFKYLAKALWNSKVLFFSLPIILVVAVNIILLFVSPVWEGVAVVELGQYGNSRSFVESPSEVIVKTKNPSFIKSNVFGDVQSPTIKADLKLIKNSLRITQVKNSSDLLEIKMRAYSSEKTRAFLDLFIKGIIARHDAMSSPRTRLLQKKLDMVTEDLLLYEKKIKTMEKVLMQSSKEMSFKDSVILDMMLSRFVSERRALEYQKLDLDNELSSNKNLATRVVEDIIVSQNPVSPNRLLLSLLTFVGGLITVFLVVYLREWFKLNNRHFDF